MTKDDFKIGEKINCWYPNWSARPWKATVVSVEDRYFQGEVDGVLVGVAPRGCCKTCGTALVSPGKLGHEWFDPEYARARRREGR